MRRNILFILAATLLLGGAFVVRSNAAGPTQDKASPQFDQLLRLKPTKETAVVQFDEMLRLRDVFLRGRYTIIHDEEKMAKGEDCTWIYDAHGKYVTSFHCTPVERKTTDKFKVIVSRRTTALDVPQVLEIQFPLSFEGHQVPVS
jgi:hypothetical protein